MYPDATTSTVTPAFAPGRAHVRPTGPSRDADPLSIVRTEPAARDLWSEIYERCPYATYFHSPAWADIWSQYDHGWRPDPLRVVFSDGRQAIVPWSVLEADGWPRRHASSPAGTFGGWISTDALTPAHGRLLQRVLIATPSLTWRVNPYDPIASALSGRGLAEDTHSIDLRMGRRALDEHWRRCGTMHASVRRAHRGGVQTTSGTTEDDWRDYHRLYGLSLSRWGDRVTSRYSWPLFSLLRAQPESTVRLWLARLDGEAIAGAVVFYTARHVVYWHGAADASRFNLRPVMLLMHDVVTDAMTRGYWWFDFNPSGGHASVERFKRTCGGRPLSAPVVVTAAPAIGGHA